MKSLSLLVLLVLVGCALMPTSDFYPYVGKQKAWPVADGGLMVTVDGVQIFHGRSFPSQAYEVIGKLVTGNGNDKHYAVEAKKHGADAVIITAAHLVDLGTVTTHGTSFTYGTAEARAVSPGYATGAGFSTTVATPSSTTRRTATITAAWLVKFKTASQVRLDELQAILDWCARHPGGSPATNAFGVDLPAYSADDLARVRAKALDEQRSLLSGSPSGVDVTVPINLIGP